MQEIKIPEGCKASIDFEKRVVVIEREKEEFKKGDIVFASDHNNLNKAIFIYMKYEPDPNGLNGYHYYTQLNLITKDLYYTDSMSSDWVEIRLATPPEAQLLFDALAKRGKRWNATTLQIEDIKKDILVPESIGIYRCREDLGVDGDGLYVGFNDRTQILYYNSKYNAWGVCPLHIGYEKVQCKLIPCKREDLKKGETAFHSYSCTPSFSNIHQYSKIIDNNYHVFANSRKSVINESNEYPYWYKVEPINK